MLNCHNLKHKQLKLLNTKLPQVTEQINLRVKSLLKQLGGWVAMLRPAHHLPLWLCPTALNRSELDLLIWQRAVPESSNHRLCAVL